MRSSALASPSRFAPSSAYLVGTKCTTTRYADFSPAGSGKTTGLSEWTATTEVAVAWLSCESADNDPARFFSYLLAQLSRLDERLTRVDQVDPFWDAHDYERLLSGPLNDLARVLQQDGVVLLDDYHLITTDAIHAALRFLLEHLPARMNVLHRTPTHMMGDIY